MERISPLQVAALLVAMRSVIHLSLLPVVSATPGSRDAWIASILGTVLAVIPTWLACRLTVMMPDKDLIQMCEHLLGKLLGKMAGFLFLGFFAMNAAVVLRQFSDFLTTAPMPETPTEFFLGAMALTTAYAIRKGLEPIARTNEMLLLPLFLFAMFVLGMGIPQMDPNRLKPYLAEGFFPVLTGASVVLGLWTEVMIIPMLAPKISDPRSMWRYALGSLAFSGIWLTLSALSAIMFFSPPEARVQVFPVYTLMRSVTLADFFERMDPLFLVVWTVASITKLALLSYVSCQGLARLLGLQDFRSLALPMGLAGAVVALTQFESVVDLQALNTPTTLPFLTLPFWLILPAILLAVALLVRGRGAQL